MGFLDQLLSGFASPDEVSSSASLVSDGRSFTPTNFTSNIGPTRQTTGDVSAPSASFASSSEPSFLDTESIRKEFGGEIDSYVSNLKQTAQGDFDFITKFIDKQHKIALGENDEKRAQFMEAVANSLEKEVGRIPFDFMIKSDREKKDLSDFLRKQAFESKDLLEREKQFAEQQEFATEREQRGISEQAGVRGVLGSGIEKRQQAEAAEERRLTQADPFRRKAALERIRREFETGRGTLESGRRTEDITTTSRRLAQNQEFTTQQSREKAERELAEARKKADIEGSLSRKKLELSLGTFG